MKVGIFIALLSTLVGFGKAQQPLAAVAVLNVGNVGPVAGSVQLQQERMGAPVIITGEIRGLQPNSIHGFHVHKSGDIRNGCTSAGGHFNPLGMNHGAPTDLVRHVGDLGNIQAGPDGVARIHILDNMISLCGPNSIIGRAFVLHSNADDLGRGGNPESLKTGNAGSRIGCGIIGVL